MPRSRNNQPMANNNNTTTKSRKNVNTANVNSNSKAAQVQSPRANNNSNNAVKKSNGNNSAAKTTQQQTKPAEKQFKPEVACKIDLKNRELQRCADMQNHGETCGLMQQCPTLGKEYPLQGDFEQIKEEFQKGNDMDTFLQTNKCIREMLSGKNPSDPQLNPYMQSSDMEASVVQQYLECDSKKQQKPAQNNAAKKSSSPGNNNSSKAKANNATNASMVQQPSPAAATTEGGGGSKKKRTSRTSQQIRRNSSKSPSRSPSRSYNGGKTLRNKKRTT